ncbi:hypothetical protein CL619_01420 [archaeon]|nr:hypothetical protein [archaeon]|tara:strand:+ start:5201 stop:5719 length:519 start_codon:yes stop_codon:yes gene_type:complete
MQKNQLIMEKLKLKHELEYFKSYEKDLANYLIQDALYSQQLRLSTTFLCFHKNILVGYITLLADKITLKGDLQLSFRNKGIPYQTLPALKIGRLCVDDSFLRRGIGRQLVSFAIFKADIMFKEIAGCRFLTVDAKHKKIIPFYEKIGFTKLSKLKVNNKAMILDLNKINTSL